MKRIASFVFMIAACFMLCICVNGDETEDYKTEIYDSLEPSELYGITVENMSDISFETIFEHIGSLISESVKAPMKIVVIVIVFAMILRIVDVISNGKSYCQDVCVIATVVSISPYILQSLEGLINVMSSAQGFLAAYVPIYASVVTASGNLKGALSYNAVLLYASEGAALVMTVLIKPVIGLMLVSTIVHTLDQEIPDIALSIRRLITTLIGLIMNIFLGVIGLQSVVGRTQDSLTVKAGKYLVASFVPIIGNSLNESYRTVRASLDSIRSVVGTFGIVMIVAIFLAPVISATVYKWTMTLCEFLCGLLSGGKLLKLMKGIAEVYSLLSTVITLYMLMLIIATGSLIALGGGINS